MSLGKVIRKYRKIRNLTQEEMANRLGVTAPAVNKWENGNSNPDIELLAPIARLLRISLDTLMSFREGLTLSEIGDIVRQIDSMFETEEFEKVYEWALGRIKEYPNCNMLIWQIAVMLDARRTTGACTEPEKYDTQINLWYETALEDENEEIKHYAADSLFGFYLRKKEYAKAEEYLRYFSDHDPRKKLYLGRLYEEQGKTKEAYEILETALFCEHQTLISTYLSLIRLAMEEEDIEKAYILTEKMGVIAGTFAPGQHKDCSFPADTAGAENRVEGIYRAVEQILQTINGSYDFQKSEIFHHMKFCNPECSYAQDAETAVLHLAGRIGAGSWWIENKKKGLV